MVLRWMQCCLWALWKQQSICRLQQQGHRQDVWEVVNDDHYYFLLIFCLFVCSAQISSSIRPGRVSVYVLCFFFFLPLIRFPSSSPPCRIGESGRHNQCCHCKEMECALSVGYGKHCYQDLLPSELCGYSHIC